MEEVLLRPDFLRNVTPAYIALRYLSVPPVANYDYVDREVVARSLGTPEFRSRLTANLAKAASLLEGAGRSPEAVFDTPRNMPAIVSQNQNTFPLDVPLHYRSQKREPSARRLPLLRPLARQRRFFAERIPPNVRGLSKSIPRWHRRSQQKPPCLANPKPARPRFMLPPPDPLRCNRPQQ
jgi:hypothetical protein